MKLIFATILMVITTMAQLSASLAFHLMNSGQSSEIEHHSLMAQLRMDREMTLKSDCSSACQAQLLNLNGDTCKSAFHASGSDTHRSCHKGRNKAYHETCLDRCQSIEAMASPFKKSSSFEACKHFQKGTLRDWCIEGFASVYRVVHSSLKQSKVAAEAELAIQATEELIFESDADSEEDLDTDQAAEDVESGVVDDEVDGDQAVVHIVKDEADAQVHVAVGENVVVIGVDARVDANRAVAELKPGNSTQEPPKTEDSSMLWQLELGVEANAIKAVGEQIKLDKVDVLKSEPNLMLLGSNDLETNEVESYARAVQHASNTTAASWVPDSPFRDKHNLSKLPSRVPDLNDIGADLNLNSDIIASIDRGGTFLSIWNEIESNWCYEVEEANIGLMDRGKDLPRRQTTCFEEDIPIITIDDDGSSNSCFAPLSELIGYHDTGMNSIISHPCVDSFDARFKHLSITQSRYDVSLVKNTKLNALAWSLPPMHLTTIDRRVMYDYDVGKEDPNSSAAFCTGTQTWNSGRFDLRYIQAQRCRSLRSQLNCFVDPRVSGCSSLYFQVYFKLKAKYDEDVKHFRLEAVPEDAMISSGMTRINPLSQGVASLKHIIRQSLSSNCLFRHTFSSATLFKAQDILRDLRDYIKLQLFVAASIDALSNDAQLVAVTSNSSSRVELALDHRFSQSCFRYMMNVCEEAMDLCMTCWLYRLKPIAEERGKPIPTEVSISIFFDTSWPIFVSFDIWKCLMKLPSDRGPSYEHAIDSSTVRREFSPDAVLGIEDYGVVMIRDDERCHTQSLHSV